MRSPKPTASVDILRTDSHDSFVEGSACTVRVYFGRDAAGSDRASDDDSGPQPHTALTEGGLFFREWMVDELDHGSSIRIDAWDEGKPWRWPVRCRTGEELEAVMRTLEAEADRLHDLYPIEVWIIPDDGIPEADMLIEACRENPASRDFWRRIIALGVVRVTIDTDAFAAAVHCETLDRTVVKVTSTLARLGIHFKAFE